jgi:hypothetical protein
MASSRGFLNIQSLNELTYENRSSVSTGCRRAATARPDLDKIDT